ncbi:DNA ligase [Achromobacter phage Motura]|uniref:DNA ligase (NAD(+)) n=1 Tax=Achromobacter phage Motura TaxID=2591403 RepID=A0A514CSV6_9CAUD|nr:NAD-dependent DNA ligase [Achromobacter phage Motura]QDH83545.1 DNA ligase [Achromobacter phage Motura]
MTIKFSELTLAQKKTLYKKACESYYAGESGRGPKQSTVMTDAQFDRLEDLIKAEQPDWVGLKRTNTNAIGKKEKVKLPHFMPSLNKAYPEHVEARSKHLEGNSVVIMDKLDGSSIYAQYKGNKCVKLITRGDGITGKDISFLIPHLNLPKIQNDGVTAFRIEALMKNSVFAKKYAKLKDKDGEPLYSNPRNLVAGILNRKLDHKTDKGQLLDIDLVVLGVFAEPIKYGLEWARKVGLSTVQYSVISKSKAKAEQLSKLLEARRAKSDYAMDGLVVIGSEQVFNYESSDKPKWTWAFKENLTEDTAPDALVKRIIWQQSHSNRLIPKVEIEPVEIDGVTIKFATVHNAKWMVDRKIGPGAVIKIVRSGDVIPKIIAVVKPGKLQLPDVDYVTKGVHFVATEATTESSAKKIERFLKAVGIEGWKQSSIEKHLETMATIDDYIIVAGMGAKDAERALLDIGVGTAAAKKLAAELQKLNGISVIKLMAGSGIFDAGVGERRLTELAKHIKVSNWFKYSRTEFQLRILEIQGFGEALAKEIAWGVHKFRVSYNEWKSYIDIKLLIKTEKKAKPTSLDYLGVKACWTGYRAPEQEAEIIAGGGEVVSFTGKTTHLFYKEGGKTSSKIAKAGDRAMTWEQFKGQ